MSWLRENYGIAAWIVLTTFVAVTAVVIFIGSSPGVERTLASSFPPASGPT